MERVKSKISIPHDRGNIIPGDEGKTQASYFSDKVMKQVPVHFYKHQRVGEWYPVWVDKNDLDRAVV